MTTFYNHCLCHCYRSYIFVVPMIKTNILFIYLINDYYYYIKVNLHYNRKSITKFIISIIVNNVNGTYY